ncbi:unnamed protein product [Fraxinus pennsylvanica]|uniref:C3H1-type domain-containing protein n=1 Tax=Fraxinus pennsylvanica TaxID=56036 RepID=A0AAD2E1J6_9LAMI|nr:unnamed protein product [Fraxinus pennsylvanica]
MLLFLIFMEIWLHELLKRDEKFFSSTAIWNCVNPFLREQESLTVTYFLKTQRCKFGIRCKFNHPKDKVVPQCAPDNADASVLPERPSELPCANLQLFIDHLVVYEREDRLSKINIYHLPAIGEPVERLEGGRALDFVDLYTHWICRSQNFLPAF